MARHSAPIRSRLSARSTPRSRQSSASTASHRGMCAASFKSAPTE